MRKAERVTYTSEWKKDNKICKISSSKDVVKWANGYYPERYGHFTFSGYNPFPCREMRSTYGIICSWMLENGWERTGNMTKWVA